MRVFGALSMLARLSALILASLPALASPEKACAVVSPEEMARRQSEVIPRTEISLGKYFDALDFSKKENAEKLIPQTEKELITQSESLLADLEAGKVADPKEASRLLIYTALFMKNADLGVLSGSIEVADLRKARKYSDSENKWSELKARHKHVVALLEEAQKHRPDDKRVDGWLASVQLLDELAAQGTVTQPAKDRMMAAIDAYPAFNLWTFFLAQDNARLMGLPIPLNAAEKEKIRALSYKFAMDPSTREDPAAKPSYKAPNNTFAAVSILGDNIFFNFLADPERSLTARMKDSTWFPYMLRGIYGSPESHGHNCDNWRDNEARLARLKSVPDMWTHALSKEKNFPKYREALKDRRVYQCASCHSAPTQNP
jgi:hypothetical protein